MANEETRPVPTTANDVMIIHSVDPNWRIPVSLGGQLDDDDDDEIVQKKARK